MFVIFAVTACTEGVGWLVVLFKVNTGLSARPAVRMCRPPERSLRGSSEGSWSVIESPNGKDGEEPKESWDRER